MRTSKEGNIARNRGAVAASGGDALQGIAPELAEKLLGEPCVQNVSPVCAHMLSSHARTDLDHYKWQGVMSTSLSAGLRGLTCVYHRAERTLRSCDGDMFRSETTLASARFPFGFKLLASWANKHSRSTQRDARVRLAVCAINVTMSVVQYV